MVGVTSDGASVMIKFGKENEFIHQLYLAHFIHLTVCDVLYKGKKHEKDDEKCSLKEDNQEIIEDWDDYDTPLDMAFESEINCNSLCGPDINEAFGEIISKVRRICKVFRKSPLKNDYLQEIFKNESKGKELKLILDTSTRWNSIIAMISRFIELKSCIPRALRVCEIDETISDEEWKSLDVLLNTLRPFEIAIKGLSTEDGSLLKGENSVKFILKELNSLSSVLATRLKKSLIERYNSRRMNEFIGLILYLEDPDIVRKTNCSRPFILPNYEMIKRLVKATFNRLYQSNDLQIQTEEEEGDILLSTDITNELNDPMLHRYLTEVVNKSKKSNPVSLFTVDLGKDLKLYEATGKRSERLEKLYRSLCTIKATSVESERAFSSAGYFLTKIRSRLSPKTLDVLTLWKSYFANIEK